MEGSCDYVGLNNKGASTPYLTSEGDVYDGSESGVEPDYAEWVFDGNMDGEDVLLDLSDDQAMAALRYFSSTAQRTNMLTKTHSNDLDLISQLLADKEKDLEMTAKIGQSLLQRNKHLMMKIESMEDFLSQTTENAAQLEHDLQMKNKLVRLYTRDEEENRSTTSSSSKEEKSLDDQEMANLTNRCRKLERENQHLFTEALSLRQMTEEIEDKEEGLVMDCIEQLASAKEQITQLTDEIALKFEDNLQQQMEISQLINTVVELQKKQKQLVEENEGLHDQLVVSTQNRENLQDQLLEMQMKFHETKEMMLIHQEELKSLKSQLENSGNPYDWLNDSPHSLSLQDSLANEIEESVRRDLESSLERSKLQNRKLLEKVSHLNKAGSNTTSGRSSPVSTWSFASDERSETTVETSDRPTIRKPSRKLQIVKPLEGSDTLNKWHHLASKNVKGGLNAAEENIPETEVAAPALPTVEPSINITIDPAAATKKPATDSTTDDDGIEVHRTPKQAGGKNTLQVRPRLLAEINTPHKKTIITRNSSALKSLREGRKMLKSKQKEGRSQAEVIDMISNVMGKVHLKDDAGQRILSSLSSPTAPGRSSDSHPRSGYENMPNVTRALEKAAQINDEELALELSESLNATDTDGKLESAASNYDSGAEGLSYSTITPSDCTSATHSSTPLSSNENSSTNATGLHGITGPLGLLNRAKPAGENSEILNEVRRYSVSKNVSDATSDSTQKNLLDRTTEEVKARDDDVESSVATLENRRDSLVSKSSGGVTEKEDATIRRNNSSTSLVEMVLSKRLSTRQIGLSNLITNSNPASISNLAAENDDIPLDGEEIDIDVDSKTRSHVGEFSKSVEAALDDTGDISKAVETSLGDSKEASKSVETGLDDVKNEGSGLFGFFSFLGKLS